MRDPARGPAIRAALHRIVEEVYPALEAGGSASDAVRHACRLLEDDPLFNAGTGAVLQVDGQVRLSASLMDGARQSFSGVINARRIRNPIELAAHLQDSDDRVLSTEGVEELARELAIPLWDNMIAQRLTEWVAERDRDFTSEMAAVAASEDTRSGTVGAVALDTAGRIVAGTSTGGRGFERVGRVSDSATPAGNFANAHAGVSATGVGEHILDECLAAKIAIRVEDGSRLLDAMQRCMDEGRARHRRFGAIALDREGHVVMGKTSEILLAAYMSEHGVADTLDVGHEPAAWDA